jgi:hypothetical protein
VESRKGKLDAKQVKVEELNRTINPNMVMDEVIVCKKE